MKNFITWKGLVFILTIILCFSFATIKNIDEPKSSETALVSSDEPGEHIIISGVLVDHSSGEILPNTEIFFFQANKDGYYEPKIKDDERSARISGTVTTNENGYFKIYTILPGNYPNAPKGRAHIHAEIKSKNHRKVVKDVLFDHDVSDQVRKWANESGNGIVIKLKDKNGKRKAYLELNI